MSREAVLLQWERKVEVAERLEDESAEAASAEIAAADAADLTQPAELADPVSLDPAERMPRRGRFERSTPSRSAPPTTPSRPFAERRTITITGRPTPGAAPARRRRALVDAQLAQPDRIALWAFLLGLLLVAVAAGTAHA